MDTIRILIADDHPVVRQGLAVLLKQQDDLNVVGIAADGDEAVQMATEHHPDVIVMDLQMPVKDGIQAIQEIVEANLSARILVLSSYPEDENVYRAIKAGATGFLLKESLMDQVIEAVRAVYRGEAAISPGIARRLIKEVQQPPPKPLPDDLLTQLTQREMEVLICLTRGMSNKDIAQKLDVSVRTVTSHVQNILSKLHLANRTQAALYALEKGVA